MFGYIECNRSKLSREELERYQSVYCGLCRTLKERYGELERMSLSYDMTFAVLFLSSLYEPAEKVERFGQNVPMRLAGQPCELAPAYVYLASRDSSYVTGQVIHVNGGTITGS